MYHICGSEENKLQFYVHGMSQIYFMYLWNALLVPNSIGTKGLHSHSVYPSVSKYVCPSQSHANFWTFLGYTLRNHTESW